MEALKEPRRRAAARREPASRRSARTGDLDSPPVGIIIFFPGRPLSGSSPPPGEGAGEGEGRRRGVRAVSVCCALGWELGMGWGVWQFCWGFLPLRRSVGRCWCRSVSNGRIDLTRRRRRGEAAGTGGPARAVAHFAVLFRGWCGLTCGAAFPVGPRCRWGSVSFPLGDRWVCTVDVEDDRSIYVMETATGPAPPSPASFRLVVKQPLYSTSFLFEKEKNQIQVYPGIFHRIGSRRFRWPALSSGL